MKHRYFEHLHLKSEENVPRRIHIAAEYIDKLVDKPLANWEIKKPTETVILKQIPFAKVEPFSSVYPMHEAALLKFTNNTYPGKKLIDKLTACFISKRCSFEHSYKFFIL